MIGRAPHGVIGIEQLRVLGVPYSLVRSRVIRGRMFELHRGVYSVVHPSMLKPEGRWLAAVLRCQPGAALSTYAAGEFHGLRGGQRHTVDVTIAGRRQVTAPGIAVHRSTTLRSQDIAVIRGIPVTTVARTILDLAGVLSRDELLRVLEGAEVERVLDEVALREQIARNLHTRAAMQLGRLLDEYEYDKGAVMNAFEAAMRAALREAGAPEPVKNEWIALRDGGRRIRPDFQWPDQKVVLHADGFKFHRSRWKFERDLRNDQRLIDADWIPIRCSYRQLRDETDRVIGTVLRQLAARAKRAEAA